MMESLHYTLLLTINLTPPKLNVVCQPQIQTKQFLQLNLSTSNKENQTVIRFTTVKPLIKNTSEEFIKCRLDHFSLSFILYYVNFSICENK